MVWALNTGPPPADRVCGEIELKISKENWASALNVSESQLRTWKNELPKNRSLTHWCLEQGLLDPSAYFKWAKNHYGLAYLDPRFFNEAFDQKLWQQIQSVANWSQEMIPVAQWNGVAFVACAEPPAEIQWSFPVRYLLANPEDMNRFWSKLHSKETTSEPSIPEPPPEISEVPSGLELPVEPPAVPDVPDGLVIDTSLTKADAEIPVSTSEDDIPTDPAMYAPEGLSLNAESKPPVLKLNLDSTSFKLPDVPENTPTSSEAFPPPPTHKPEDTPMASAPPDADFTEITRIAGSLDFLKQDFEASMILAYRNGKLKPLIWDAQWKPVSEPKGPINLSDPSAFRIVVRSKNPYLGHIVDTPVNRTFFNSWGMTELPEKILVQPLVDKQSSEVVGVFISLCNPSLKNQVILSAAERHSDEILRLMLSANEKAA